MMIGIGVQGKKTTLMRDKLWFFALGTNDNLLLLFEYPIKADLHQNIQLCLIECY